MWYWKIYIRYASLGANSVKSIDISSEAIKM
jgi:hypothetical protein